MGLDQHAARLCEKHAHLDSLIAKETQRPLPDWQVLNQLKKEKLRLKEVMSTTSGRAEQRHIQAAAPSFHG